MAGYNLNLIDDETFEKRIDRINKGKLSAQKKAERIALIRAAQEKIMASKKLAEEARQQKELERQRAAQERQRQRDQRRSDRAYRDETGEGSGYSGGFDASTGNYDDPFSPGDTE
jgi:DNA-binding protein H-NS